MSNFIYIEKIPVAEQPLFKSVLIAISNALGVNPNYLMQVFHAESRVNPKAFNKTSKAAGLIQFMPSTAAGLGTTTEALLKMNATEQLDWVYKYFKPYTGRLNSYADVYFVVFFPAAIGKTDDWVLKTSKLSPEIIAKQNPAINIIKDGKITVGEFKQYLKNTVAPGFTDIIFSPATTIAAVADKVIPGNLDTKKKV